MFNKQNIDNRNTDTERTRNVRSCRDQAPSDDVRFDDRQFSAYVLQQVNEKRAQLVTQVGGQDLGILAEHDTWLGMELLRRFGQRQGRGIETVFKIKRQFYKFAATTVPVNFGDCLIFPLESA